LQPVGGTSVFSFRDDLERLELTALHLEDELAQEGLVVLLAEQLVALREVVAFLHLQALEGLDQLHRVFLAAEAPTSACRS
jgi:hypothetical protein